MTNTVRLALAAAFLLMGSLHAQAQDEYFGQNKVHYKRFKWEVLTTPHFEVYYYKGEEETARDAARMAERGYARLSRVLRHRISDPIPLILYASHTDFQQTNVIPEFIEEGTGGVTEFLKSRVFLPFTGSYAELEHVLIHELVHAFQGDIMFGSSPGASMLNPLAFQAPLWFMEGMAEYLSIGRVDEHTKMWLRDAALQGYLTSIPELSYTYDIRIYRFGQAIWAYIGNRYGDEKVGEILRKAPRLRSLDEAFKSAIGKNLQELSDAWTEDVRKTYLPQIAQFEKPKDFSRQLTDHQKDRSNINLAPAISPRGDKMVFISDRSLYNDMYLASAIDGKVITKLVEGERTGSFESLRFFSTAISWSPDERYLAFPAKIGAQDALYVMDVRKKKIVRRMKFGLDGLTSPTWSPDGHHLVFVGLRGGQSDIYMVDADGKNFKALTQDRYTDRDPAWSPDGTKIALTTDRGTGTDFPTLTFGSQQIALYDVATGQIEVLPDQDGKNINPQWSGDGQKLAFISDRTEISNIFIMDLTTRQTYQVTNILTGITNITPEGPALSWAQKGNRLIFSAFSTGGWDIFSISDPTRLMKDPYVPPVTTAAVSAVRPPTLASLLPDSSMTVSTPAESDTMSTAVDENTRPDAADAAAPVDTTTFTTKSYSPRFTLDYIGGNAGYASSVGVVGQSILSLSDVLGNHNILFGANIFGSLTDADLLFQYTNLARRTNFGVALFQYRFDQYYYFLGPTVLQTQTQVNRGAGVFLSRPFNRFSRFELSVQGVNRTRELVDITTTFYGIRRNRRGSLSSVTFASPAVALVSDNILYGITGPIAGSRGRLEVTPTVGELRFMQVLVDYRKYFNVFQNYAFAFRLYGLINEGRDQELLPFGGPYDFRGLDFWSVWGSKAGLLNIEFRFPLIEVLRLGWPLPLALDRIRGVLYMDVGGAWDQRTSALQAGQYSGYPNAGTLDDSGRLRGTSTIQEVAGGPVAASYGFGARSRLSFLVFKFDVAHQIDLGLRPTWFNNEGIPGIQSGLEEEIPGTRSYRLRRGLADTKFFFTIGADF